MDKLIQAINAEVNSKLLIDNPEVWEAYADPDCLYCGGVGEEVTVYGLAGRMCQCVSFEKAAEDGWILD